VHRALLGLLFAALSIVVATYAWVASLSTYAADDFCFAEVVRNHGLLGAQVQWYFGWGGRYASNLAISLATLLGPDRASYAGGAAVVLLGATASTAAVVAARAFRRTGSGLAYATVGLLPVLFLLSAAPARFQTTYWLTGVLTYTAPLAFTIVAALFIATAFARRNSEDARGHRRVAIPAAAAFIAAGSSETLAFAQLATLSCILLAAVVAGGGRMAGRAGATLWAVVVATLLGCLVVGLAPGNANRVTALTNLGAEPIADPLRAAWLAVWSMRRFVVTLGDGMSVYAAVACVLAPMAIGASLPPDARQGEPAVQSLARWLVAIPFIALLFAFFSHVPYAIFPGNVAIPRALTMPTLIVGAAAVAWSFVAGRAIRPPTSAGPSRRPLAWARFCLLALATSVAVLVLEVRKPLEDAAQLHLARSDWDGFDGVVRSAIERGDRAVVATPLANPMGVGEFTADRTFWVNRCIADMYGVDSIALAPPGGD
jgi:Family of unknown function (DUF6056)